MSIGSSFTAPPTTRRSQLFRQQSVAASRTELSLGRPLVQDTVRFGNATATVLPSYKLGGKDYVYRKNAVWVTVEDRWAKVGGMGEVADTIPKAATTGSTPQGFESQRDMRVISPFVKTMREENDRRIKAGEPHFKPTNVAFQVKVKDGENAQFRVWQMEEPFEVNGQKKQFVRYTLESPIFDKVEKIDSYEAYDPKSKALLIPFNRGASKLIHYLKPGSQEELKKMPPPKGNEEALKVFDSDQMTAIGNDHLSGPVLYQPEIVNDPDIRKGFVYHNIYDSAVPAAEAAYDRGYEVPKDMSQWETYSPLTLAPRVANWAVIDKNFGKTLLETDFAKGQIYVPPLRAHAQAHSLMNIHHPLAPEFTPINNPDLQRKKSDPIEQKQQVKDCADYQFVPLSALPDSASQEEVNRAWKTFKDSNKLALQKKYGLTPNKDAVLMGWAARLEPNQKGFDMVKNNLKQMLEKHPNLQIVIAGNVGNPEKLSIREKALYDWVQKFNEEVDQDESLKGRIYFPNRFVKKDEITQINAASDFTILPSLYEPYGITQLEAYKMGSIPLVHAVDGIRSTVHDPQYALGADLRVTEHGQTAVLMEPLNNPENHHNGVTNYRKALSRDEMIMTLEDKVNKSPNKVYKPEGKTKEARMEPLEGLVKMLGDLSAEGNLHLPLSLKDRCVKLKGYLEYRYTEHPQLTETDLAVLRDIRKVDQEKIIEPANQKFANAIDRAMTFNQSQRDEIRNNGRRYLDQNHSLAAIGERWRNILDSTNTKPSENLEFGPPAFPKPRKTAELLNDGQSTTRKRKPVVVQKKPDGFLANAWEGIKNTCSAIVFYLNPFNWFNRNKSAAAPQTS